MRARGITARFAAAVGSLLWLLGSSPALAQQEFLGVRNYNPFVQVFGFPGFADASVLERRETSLVLTTTITNHSDIGRSDLGDPDLGIGPAEMIVVDGESYVTNLALGFGVSDRLTLGVEVPWVAYGGGVFDGAIEWWHDLWGFPNGFRDGPNDELLISYASRGADGFVLDDSASGIGDVRLDAKYRVMGSADADLGLVLRAGVKLATGDAAGLRGSEAVDFSFDLALRKTFGLPLGEVVLLASAGALLLGEGEVLPHLQRETVGFAGLGTLWRLNQRWRFNLQLYAQTSYFDSDVAGLGSDSMSLTAGGSYTWVDSKLRLSVAIIEDVVTDLTPDVGLRIELTKDF
jgi:hypothetical protein